MAEQDQYLLAPATSDDHKRLSHLLPEPNAWLSTPAMRRQLQKKTSSPKWRAQSLNDLSEPKSGTVLEPLDEDSISLPNLPPSKQIQEIKRGRSALLSSAAQGSSENTGRVGRMSPLARTGYDTVRDNDDVLFRNYREEASLADSMEAADPPPVYQTASVPIDTTNEIEQPPDHTTAQKTFRRKIKAITQVLRSTRKTQSTAPHLQQISWKSKALAMANLIKLSRVSSEPASSATSQGLVSQPSLSTDSSSGSRKTSRRKRRKNSTMAVEGPTSNSLMVKSALLKNNRDLMDIVARQDEQGGGRFPAMAALKVPPLRKILSLGFTAVDCRPWLEFVRVLLASDKSTEELIELAYEPRRLHTELRALLQKHEREEKKRQAMEEADTKQQPGRRRHAGQGQRKSAIMLEQQLVQEEAQRRQELGYGVPKDAFARMVGCQEKMAGNQMVVARLMQALVDLNQEGQSKKWNLWWMRWYSCLDPDSWVINVWTIVYMLLILHITTVGLFNIAFNEDFRPSSHDDAQPAACAHSFSPYQWFDAGVDLFFIIDILCRLFLFGQIVESKTTVSSQSKMEVVVDPEEVLRTYVRNGLAVDLLTAIPIQWISMALEAACYTSNSSPLLLARCLRIFRITRVVKLFRTYKVRMWMRRLKRLTGNTSIMQVVTVDGSQMMHLVLGLAFLNHVWTCLSWIIQSLDDEGFEEFLDRLGIRVDSSSYAQYSIMFMNTLQIVFAIEPYRGDTPLEAWFGSFTLALSVFISATMLSKILEIWQMANEAQTQRDSRINTVMQFTSRNGITTDLRNEVLDYFEFRYSNPAADFEKRFLDDLPTEMQARVISQMFPGALEKSALFTGTSEMFIAQLIVRIARRPVPTMPQQIIIAQGAFGSEMFLLKSGTVEVSTVDEEGQQTHVTTLGPGSTFGDLSMWMDSRHNATVTSLEFCQLHMLTRHDLEETLQSFPEIAHVIASQALAHCLRSPILAHALEGISVSAAERMGRRMAHNRVEFEPGEALYLEGEEAETAYVIRKGKVEVELLQARLEGLEDVRCGGFDALLSCRCYQETVRARETVVAYSISAHDIVDLFARDKDLLEEREAVAEQHYKHVTSKLVNLRWTLLSQDLLARHTPRTAPNPDATLTSTASMADGWEDESSGEGLAEQLVSFLRSEHPDNKSNHPLTSVRIDS